jgi:hypothetical protein
MSVQTTHSVKIDVVFDFEYEVLLCLYSIYSCLLLIYQPKNHVCNEDRCYEFIFWQEVIGLHSLGKRNRSSADGTIETQGIGMYLTSL